MTRLGTKGAAVGALLALSFGSAGGLLFARWRAAEASQRPAIETLPAVDLERVPPLAASVLTRRAVNGSAGPALGEACGRPGARLVRWRVWVDPALGVRRRTFAAGVRAVLCDERSWIASGRVRFRYDPRGGVLVSLRTPVGTERRCLQLIGSSVGGRFSCAGAREAVLNAARWLGGSPTWPGSVRRYRALLVNHEVGHVLGQGHRGCARAGERAPAMMQQSKGLGGCRAGAWPLPYELRSLRG